jgi:hypothetical protein
VGSKVERTDPHLWEHVKRELMKSDKDAEALERALEQRVAEELT